MLGKLSRRIILITMIVSLSATSSYGESKEVVVQKGDSLYKIARDYFGDENRWPEIAEENNIEPPYAISVGDNLRLLNKSSLSKESQTPIDEVLTENPEPVDSPSEPMSQPSSQPSVSSKSQSVSQSHIAAGQGEDTKISTAVEEGIYLETSVLDEIRVIAPDFVPNFTLNIERLSSLALKNSPTIKKLEAKIQAAEARSGWAGSLPDPKLMGSIQNASFDEITIGDKSAGMSMAGFQLQQAFPAESKRRADKEIALSKIDEQRSVLSQKKARIISKLRQNITEIYRIDQSAEVVALMHHNYRNIEKSLAERYAVGTTSQSSLIRIQAEVTRLTKLISVYEQQRGTISARIRELTNIKDYGQIGRLKSIPWVKAEGFSSLSSSLILIDAENWLATSPRLLVSDARIKVAELRVKRAEAEFKSDWSVSGGVFSRVNLDPVWKFGIGMSLPVRTGSRQTPMLEEAESKRDAAVEAQEESLAIVRGEVENLSVSIEQGYFQVRLISSALLPQTRLAFESTLSQYSVGKANFENLLQSLLSLEKVELDYVASQSRLGKFISRLDELKYIQKAGE